MPAHMKVPSRLMLIAGLAIAACLALAGGFYFFSNVPNPGAAREQITASAPQIERADIDRIIAERNAFAPRPSSGAQVTAAVPGAIESPSQKLSGGATIPSGSMDNEGDDLFKRGLYPEAIAYWRQAADRGDRWSAYRLGVEYLDGKPNVVSKDIGEGAKWIRVAAELNEPSAQFELANLYEYGIGVSVSLEEAARWYLKAAERGHVQGQYNVATMLESGDGIPQDKIEALKYYTLAAAGGFSGIPVNSEGELDSSGSDARENLRASLTSDVIAEAERRAEAFVPLRD
jgi:tetratricopeptide (TPR) repeat protein